MRFEKKQQINGIPIYYELVGSDEPTLLLIHGLGSEPGLLRGTVNHFRTSWRVLVPMLRGHVPSGLDLPFSTEQVVDDLVKLTEALSIKRLVAVGFSRGAQIAFSLAALRPDLVEGVVSLGGMVRTTQARLDSAPSLYAMLESDGGLDRYAESFSGMLLSKATQATSPVLRAYGKMNMQRHDPEIMIELLKSSYATDIGPILSQVRCPTLLMIGADDQISDFRSQIEIKSRVKDCVVRVLPGVGHDYAGEAPTEINAIITEFLIGLAAERARS